MLYNFTDLNIKQTFCNRKDYGEWLGEKEAMVVMVDEVGGFSDLLFTGT